MKRFFILICLLSASFLPAMQKVRKKGKEIKGRKLAEVFGNEKVKPKACEEIPKYKIFSPQSEKVIIPSYCLKKGQSKYLPYNGTHFINYFPYYIPETDKVYASFFIEAKTGERQLIKCHFPCTSLCLVGDKLYGFYESVSKSLNESPWSYYETQVVDIFANKNFTFTGCEVFNAIGWKKSLLLQSSGTHHMVNATTLKFEKIIFSGFLQNWKVYGDYLMSSKQFEDNFKHISIVSLVKIDERNRNLIFKTDEPHELINFFLFGNKMIVALNNHYECEPCLLQVWKICGNKLQKSIQVHQTAMIKPIRYGDYIITSAGNVIKVLDENLEVVQTYTLKSHKNCYVNKLWITGNFLCAEVKKYGTLTYDTSVIRWELEQEKEIEK